MPLADGRGVHHVVWCVRAESLPRVKAFWEGVIGVPLDELDLPEPALQRSVFRPINKGNDLHVAYRGLTEAGVPRFASYVRVRPAGL